MQAGILPPPTPRRSLSFSVYIGIAAAAMAVLAILVAGSVSYSILGEHITRDAHRTLQHRAEVTAKRLEADLNAVSKAMSAFSANILLSSTLTDGAARAAYLEPLLGDLQQNSAFPLELAVTDLAGTPIAGSKSLTLRGVRHAQAVLDGAQTRVWIADVESGDAIIVATPIHYARTPVLAGALLYRLALRDFLLDINPAPAQAGSSAGEPEKQPGASADEVPISLSIFAHGINADGRAASLHADVGRIAGDPHNLVAAWQAVDTDQFGEQLAITVEAATLKANFDGPLRQLVIGCLTAGTGAIALALLLSLAIGRSVARPLHRLESVATEVVASGSLAPRFTAEGPREIARLGTAFNAMLTRLSAAQQRLSHLAQFDSLTGLANRAMFHDRLREQISSAGRTGTSLALLLLDLDKFKPINDTFGHPAGDALLRQVGDRLRGCVRETDVVARLGGDEFAIIATSLKEPTAAHTLVSKICAAFETPFDLDGQSVTAAASIGISVCTDATRNPEDLIHEADLALYQVKHEDHGGTFRFYNTAMTRKLMQRKSTEMLIRRLLATNSFRLSYQPKIDIHSGTVTGVEALLRCPPEYRHVSIGQEVIRVAESTGLINAIGAWALREACAESRRWLDRGLPMLPIALNVSAMQLVRPGFPEIVDRALRDFHLPAAAIELEITETVMMERTETIEAAFERLRLMGVRLAIDDFGTGYSSLLTLKRFPVQSLKIDASFVNGVTAVEEDAAIARAIIALGHNLGLAVIAEGLETEDQLTFLRENGCDQAQGNLVCPPVGSDALANWWFHGLAPLWHRRAASG